MKKCILVWQIPLVEGEYYNPIMYAIYIRKAKRFVSVLNECFEEKNMNWRCVLDKSACVYSEIFSSQHQVVFFVPEAKTRQWLYKKELQATCVKKYYLDYIEYNSRKIDKIIKFLNEFERKNEDESNGIIK